MSRLLKKPILILHPGFQFLFIIYFFCGIIFYRKELNYAVLELRENGELGKWEKKWFKKNDCDQYNSNKDGVQSALDLSNVAGIFYILTGGLITAVLSAVIEFLYKSKIDSQKSRVSF